MNTIYRSKIFFSIRKTGDTEILIEDGCVWHWSGVGSNIFTGRYATHIVNPDDPELLGISGDDIEPIPIDDYVGGYPDDDMGTHIYIPSQHVTINGDTKIWLLWDYDTELIDWKVTVTWGLASSYALLVQDGAVVNPEFPDLTATDTSLHILMPVEELVLLPDSFRYEVAEENPGGILIADVSFSNGKITNVNQVHEGILTLGRRNRIVGTSEIITS